MINKLLDVLFYWDFGNNQSKQLQSPLQEYHYRRNEEADEAKQNPSSQVLDNSKESLCSVSDTQSNSISSITFKNQHLDRLNAHRNTGSNLLLI
jgi:hypothetical protein